MLKERVVTALIMFFVFVGMVFFASERVWFLGIALLMAWAAAEWASLSKFKNSIKAIYVMVMPVLLAILWIAISRPSSSWVFSVLMLASLFFWLLFVPIWLFFKWRVSNHWVLGMSGFFVLLPAGVCFLYIRQSSEQGWFLLCLLLVVWIADTSAYFIGRMLGKNKLASSISPGKTREGAIGAWLAVTIYVSTFVLWLKPAGLSNWHVSVWQVFFVAFFLTYQSIMGDLYESWLKRCAGVKDSGTSLPGHGGILDRIDAILPVLPLQIILLSWLSHG